MMLDQELLNKVYQKWYYGNEPIPRWPKTYYGKGRDQRFEDWLWQQGFTVVQKDHRRYLRFSGDPKQLTFFLLKYGVQ
jgi:hypothetical protein